MIRTFRIAAVCAGVAPMLCAAPAALAAPASVTARASVTATPQATVTVTGTGTASATPDELSVGLDVSAQAPSVRTAMEQANEAMTKVSAKLTADGVAAADLQTTAMSVQPQYSSQGSVTGYTVTESLTAELRHVGTAGQTIADAVDAGGNAVRVDGVSFDLTDQQAKLMAKARANAVTDARARATEDATAAGRKLGQVLDISETDTFDMPRPVVPLAMFAGRASAVPLSAGTQQVSVTVVVSYELA